MVGMSLSNFVSRAEVNALLQSPPPPVNVEAVLQTPTTTVETFNEEEVTTCILQYAPVAGLKALQSDVAALRAELDSRQQRLRKMQSDAFWAGLRGSTEDKRTASFPSLGLPSVSPAAPVPRDGSTRSASPQHRGPDVYEGDDHPRGSRYDLKRPARPLDQWRKRQRRDVYPHADSPSGNRHDRAPLSPGRGDRGDRGDRGERLQVPQRDGGYAWHEGKGRGDPDGRHGAPLGGHHLKQQLQGGSGGDPAGGPQRPAALQRHEMDADAGTCFAGAHIIQGKGVAHPVPASRGARGAAAAEAAPAGPSSVGGSGPASSRVSTLLPAPQRGKGWVKGKKGKASLPAQHAQGASAPPFTPPPLTEA